MQSVIKKKYGQDATNVGDEGGFAPNIQVTKSMQHLKCGCLWLFCSAFIYDFIFEFAGEQGGS